MIETVEFQGQIEDSGKGSLVQVPKRDPLEHIHAKDVLPFL